MNQQAETDNKIRFPLLSNGLDFILSAVEHLSGNPSHRDHKYSVLHLCSGVELVLKERLRREHWLLVAHNPGKVGLRKHKSGNFKSVYFDECIERLNNCGVKLGEKVVRELKKYRDNRNRIEHFDMVDTDEAIKSSTATILNIIFNFIHTELNPGKLDQNDRGTLEKIHQRLFDLQDFVKTRMQEIKPELRQTEAAVVKCPRCFQNAAVLDDGLKCLFCRYTVDGEEAAEYYISDVLGHSRYEAAKYGVIWPRYRCPECWSEALVETGKDEFHCFQCGESWKDGSLQRCERCNEFYAPGPADLIICQDCFDEYMRDN